MRRIYRPSHYLLCASVPLWFIAALFCAQSSAAEWPRFRGPNGEGHAAAVQLPDRWTDKHKLWTAELPGVGHSSPVISGERIVVTSADPKKELLYVLSLNAQTGAKQWQIELASPPFPGHVRNSGATSTPAIDAERVYVTGIGPQGYFVAGLSLADGKVLWRNELGPFAAQHGFGASPMLIDNLLIVPNDQDGESFLLALDAASGKQQWRTPRRSGRASYSTPCVYEPAGQKPQLILTSADNGMTGIDPQTGQVNWSLDVFPERTVGSPVVAGNLILANCGKGNGGHSLVAVRPPHAPDGQAEVVYTLTQSVPYVTTPIVKDDLMFLINDMGIASCHELATGKRLWMKRIGGNYSGSPILVGDRLIMATNDGDFYVLSATREYKDPVRNPSGQTCRATPAVAFGNLYLRTESKLVCLGAK